MLVCGEKEIMVMAPPPMHDSAVSPCFHGCPAFLHRHFPPQSNPSHPLDPSLSIQQQPSPWDCSTIPKLQLPASAPSRESMSLSRVCTAAERTVWFSFHLGCNRSAVSLSALNVSPLTQIIAPCGDRTSASVPLPREARSSPTNTLVFLLVPSSYHFSWVYIFFSVGQVFLSTLSWCSACTYVSEGIFLTIHGERCTPCPPTPPPSCSPISLFSWGTRAS